MGIIVDKHDHLNELVVQNADIVEVNKKDNEFVFRRMDGNIENCKTRILENANMVQKPTTASGPSFKMEDLFTHGKWQAMEEFELFARERFGDLEYKIQHIDINALDTSDFVKTDLFDQFSRKL